MNAHSDWQELRELEYFLPVKGFIHYSVSNLGRVCSTYRNRGIKELHIRPSGYVQVHLYKQGKCFHKYLHRLVLETFIGQCPDGMEAAHLNGNPSDNRVVNLQWVTRKENHSHRHLHGTVYFGESHPRVKLSLAMVTEIKNLISINKKFVDIAKMYNIHPGTVSKIHRKVIWRNMSRGKE